MKGSRARRVATVGVLVALALIFSYVEVLIPFNFGIPGVKLGLANLVIVAALYELRAREAFLVDVTRIGVSSLLFGSVVSLWYSLAGGLLSFAVMALARRGGRFGTMGVSVLGGVSHNIGQLAVAVVLLGTGRLVWYLPTLLVSGVLTGALIGLVAERARPLLARRRG